MTVPEKVHVLYAEDDEDTCVMVKTMLAFSNIEVTCAPTVALAWQSAQTEKFDLYLLDSKFPDGDGLELCRRLRNFAPCAPIVFYSGHAYETDKKNGLAAGADAYLVKPFLGDLAETIFQTISRLQKPAEKKHNYDYAQIRNTDSYASN